MYRLLSGHLVTYLFASLHWVRCAGFRAVLAIQTLLCELLHCSRSSSTRLVTRCRWSGLENDGQNFSGGCLLLCPSTGLLCIQHASLCLLHCLPHIVAAISQLMQDAAPQFRRVIFQLVGWSCPGIIAHCITPLGMRSLGLKGTTH